MIKREIDESRCRATVYPNDKWGVFHGHQCSRKMWRDRYCKQHHPDTVEARQAEATKRYEKKWNNSPQIQIVKARERLAALEAERAADCRAAYLQGAIDAASVGLPAHSLDWTRRINIMAERLWPSVGKVEEKTV